MRENFPKRMGHSWWCGRTTKGSSPQLPHDGDARHAGPFDSRCRHGDSGWASQCNQHPLPAPANHGFLVRPAWGAQGAACETFDHFSRAWKNLPPTQNCARPALTPGSSHGVCPVFDQKGCGKSYLLSVCSPTWRPFLPFAVRRCLLKIRMLTLRPCRHRWTQLHDRPNRSPAAPSSSRVTHRSTTAAASAGAAAEVPTILSPTAMHIGQHANHVASSPILQRYARPVDIRSNESRQASGTMSSLSMASALGSAVEWMSRSLQVLRPTAELWVSSLPHRTLVRTSRSWDG